MPSGGGGSPGSSSIEMQPAAAAAAPTVALAPSVLAKQQSITSSASKQAENFIMANIATAAKQASEAANKARERYEKALHARAENVRHLVMDTKLRDEDEIANERPESSMSKGGKSGSKDDAA